MSEKQKMTACRHFFIVCFVDRAKARQSGKSMIFRTSTAGMNRDGCACLHAADGYAPCERARESGEPEVSRTFAGA